LESTDLGNTEWRIISKVTHPLSDSILLALTSKFRPHIGQLCDFLLIHCPFNYIMPIVKTVLANENNINSPELLRTCRKSGE
jgi:hypothetical protein